MRMVGQGIVPVQMPSQISSTGRAAVQAKVGVKRNEAAIAASRRRLTDAPGAAQ